MNYPKECPKCRGIDTQQEYQEWNTDTVLEVRTCNECPTEYTVEYGDPIKEVTYTENEDS